MNLAVGDDSHAGTQASTARRRTSQADANARLTGHWCAVAAEKCSLSRAAGR